MLGGMKHLVKLIWNGLYFGVLDHPGKLLANKRGWDALHYKTHIEAKTIRLARDTAQQNAKKHKSQALFLGSTPDSKVHGANMGPSGADRTQVGPMLAPWTLLSGTVPEWY